MSGARPDDAARCEFDAAVEAASVRFTEQTNRPVSMSIEIGPVKTEEKPA